MEARIQIDPAGVHGEKGTGYLDEERRCSTCEYFQLKNSGCTGKRMKAKSRRPKNDDGSVKVSARGNCIYWEEVDGKRGPYRRAAES